MKNIILTLLWCIAILPMWSKPNIYAYFTDLFPLDPIGTEYCCYTLLKDNPIKNINYFAVPWTILMKDKTLHTFPNIKIDGGFTVCQHFRFEEILPLLRDIGIDVLFTPHVEKGKEYNGITVLPLPHNAINGQSPAKSKDILYSFVGTQSNQAVRQAIFKLPLNKNDVIIIKRRSWGAGSTDKQENREYRNILSRSRFALCPRGYGASTIRFWEALQAGAIPVVLSDSFVLPPEIDWKECVLRVPENQVPHIDDIIRGISLAQEQKMRNNCLAAYTLYSGENIVHTIRNYYATLDTLPLK